jgi:hypothetical protein
MKRFAVARLIGAARVVGWALAFGIAAGSGAADSQTILRGSPAQPAARQAPPAPVSCPEGYYSSGGLCRPYSWSDVTTGEIELQPLYPLPVLTR